MQQMRMEMTPSDEGAQAYTPAGFWRRVFAGLFDGLLVATAAMVLLLEMIAAVSLAERCGWISLDSLTLEGWILLWLLLGFTWGLLAVIALPLAYFIVCEGACGQTLGKRLFRLVVVSAEGQPIGYGRAFARLLTLPYSLLPAGLGVLWAALPPAKRAWHDYISATKVVSLA
jgi:uncharacterized RDD family membrane protein YckC